MDSFAEKMVLVFQGGGALGAYQAGAYEALAEAGYLPRWVAGISIGAINAAILAGNRPDRRVARLRQFWELVSSRLTGLPLANDDTSRKVFNEASAALVTASGVPGLLRAAFPTSRLHAIGHLRSNQLLRYGAAPGDAA